MSHWEHSACRGSCAYGTGDKMTPAQWYAAYDVARTALAIQSADILDEQLAGFGEILRSINWAIDGLAEKFDDGVPSSFFTALTGKTLPSNSKKNSQSE